MIVLERYLAQLGNQMFQIASTIGISRSLGLSDPPYVLGDGPYNRFGIYGAEKVFKGEIEYVPVHEDKVYGADTAGTPMAYNIAERLGPPSESSLSFKPEPYDFSTLEKNKNYQILGQLMDECYFIDYKDEIVEFFTFIPEAIGLFNDTCIKVGQDHETCAIHIRLTDYVHNNRCKTEIFHQLAHEQTYYTDAMDEIGRDKKFFIFSDDIPSCKNDEHIMNIFKDVDHTFVEHSNPGVVTCVDMYLMSQCHNNIIANSSYSWWSAWLNQNNNKVIRPKKWFRKKYDHEDSLEDGLSFKGSIDI